MDFDLLASLDQLDYLFEPRFLGDSSFEAILCEYAL
jgi:hypothetical protein